MPRQAFQKTQRSYAERKRELLDKQALLCSPAADDSPGAIAARVARGRADKLWFLSYYLPHYFYSEFAPFHQEWSELADTRGVNIALFAFRDSSKSSFFTVGDVVHKCVYGLEPFIVIISLTEIIASEFTDAIGVELSRNRRIQQDFGQVLREPYAAADFVTDARGAGNGVTDIGVKVLARSWKQQVRGLNYLGHRPTHIVCDDMQDEAFVRNPANVRRMLAWIKNTLYFAKSKDERGRIIFLGTIMASRCVLSYLLGPEFAQGWLQKRYPMADADLKSNWPARVPDEMILELIRDVGRKAFYQECMGIVNDEDSIFRAEWIHYYDPAILRQVPFQVTAFVDPSIKESSGSCYKAIVVLGRPMGDTVQPGYYVLAAWVRRESINNMFDAIFRLQDRFQPDKFGFETNSYQDYLADQLIELMAPPRPVVRIVKVNQTANKDARIESMQPDFENGLVYFLADDPDQERLIEQLVYFPNVEKDGPDALEGAMRLARVTRFNPGAIRTSGRKRVGCLSY